MANDMPDLTLEVLKDIRTELREMKTDMRGLKTDMHELRSEMQAGFKVLADAIITGFVETDRRLDTVIDITGRHHVGLETRVARIEAHLKLGKLAR
jgi:hypothetical protein